MRSPRGSSLVSLLPCSSACTSLVVRSSAAAQLEQLLEIGCGRDHHHPRQWFGGYAVLLCATYPAPAYGESAYESVPIPPAPIYGEQSYGPSVYAGPGCAASVPQYAPATTCYWARGEPAWDGYRWLRRPIRVCN